MSSLAPIGGWLWLPVAYLILALLSASLMTALFLYALLQGALTAGGIASLATALIMWCFTFWTLRLLFKRKARFPKVFILWLLAGVLLGLKAFAFAPVTDALALRILFWPLLAASVMVPYIKRSQRVKRTFNQS